MWIIRSLCTISGNCSHLPPSLVNVDNVGRFLTFTGYCEQSSAALGKCKKKMNNPNIVHNFR